jgi:hypothetical protein
MASTKCLNKSGILSSSSSPGSPPSQMSSLTTTQSSATSATPMLLCSAISPTTTCQSSSTQLSNFKITQSDSFLNEFQHGTLQNDLNEIVYAVALMIVEGRHVINSDSNESWNADSPRGFIKKAVKYYVKEGEHASLMAKTVLNKINQLNVQSMVNERQKLLLNQSDEFMEDEHICNSGLKVYFYSILFEY